jgi:hypothetical protein
MQGASAFSAVDNIVAVAKLETHEDAILMAWDKIVCLLDNMRASSFYRELSSALIVHK